MTQKYSMTSHLALKKIGPGREGKKKMFLTKTKITTVTIPVEIVQRRGDPSEKDLES